MMEMGARRGPLSVTSPLSVTRERRSSHERCMGEVMQERGRDRGNHPPLHMCMCTWWERRRKKIK